MTQEIAVRSEAAALATPDATKPGTDLRLWAEQAVAAGQYAEVVCSTAMAPAQYRGKPAEATAAILAGAELGFSPMASLRAFDSIQGTPAPKAMTLRAVVQAAGHEVEIVESSDERACVRGRRNGQGEWQASVWDTARAQKLSQYKTNPNYKSNPAQMLVARATAEVCRWIGSDAIMGMPYAAEEIQGDPEYTTAPAVRRLTIDQLDGPAAIEASPADEPMSDDQRKHLFALWEELGYTTGEADRPTRLSVTAKILGLEKLGSWSDLSAGQAHDVINAFVERKARKTGGTE